MTRTGADTKSAIMNAALIIARDGLSAVTLRGVGARIGLDHAGIVHHYGNLDEFRQAIAAEAVARDDIAVVARLIMDKHPAVADWPGVKRVKYLALQA